MAMYGDIFVAMTRRPGKLGSHAQDSDHRENCLVPDVNSAEAEKPGSNSTQIPRAL